MQKNEMERAEKVTAVKPQSRVRGIRLSSMQMKVESPARVEQSTAAMMMSAVMSVSPCLDKIAHNLPMSHYKFVMCLSNKKLDKYSLSIEGGY